MSATVGGLMEEELEHKIELLNLEINHKNALLIEKDEKFRHVLSEKDERLNEKDEMTALLKAQK